MQNDDEDLSNEIEEEDLKSSSSGSSKNEAFVIRRPGSKTPSFSGETFVDVDDVLGKSTNDVEKLQQRNEVLKHFLLAERKQRVMERAKVALALKHFDNLKITHTEKMNVLRKLEWENSTLKDKLTEMEKQLLFSKKDEDEGSGFLSSLFRGQTGTPENSPMKKLTRPQLETRLMNVRKELDLYRDKYLSLEEKSACNEKVLSDLKSLYKMSNEKLIFTTSLLDERDEQLAVLDEENKLLNKKLADLQEEKRHENLGSKVVEARHQEVISKLQEAQKMNDLKEKEIEELKIKLQKKEEFADSMANKLLNMKTQMDLINLTMRKYSCKRINKLVGKSDVDIILQKNPSSGEFLLDVVYNGKHEHYLLSTISNVYLDKSNMNLFHVELANKTNMSFETEEAEDCIKAINDFVRLQLQESPWWAKNEKK